MDRTVPTSGNEDIILYIRTYYSLLRSTRAVPISSLIEAHLRTSSALHVHADTPKPDMAAFIYSVLRLPDCFVLHVERVVMGQSDSVFAQHGYPDIESWHSVSAPARRRRSFWDGDKTLGVYIASRSDIDDMIPMLVAYQIERDKLHDHLNRPQVIHILEKAMADQLTAEQLAQLADITDIELEDFEKLVRIWEDETAVFLHHFASTTCKLSVQLLAGSFAEYKRATGRWWEHIEAQCAHLNFQERPIYFISSNIHSLPNLLTGYAQEHETELIAFIEKQGDKELQQEYLDILAQNVPSNRANLLYYILKKYEADHPEQIEKRLAMEREAGIYRIPSEHVFDVEAQVIEIGRLKSGKFDTRLRQLGLERLQESDALIINIDYPLGMAAYQILSELARNIAEIRGIHLLGKAATLNGRIGDVMIPNVVHDEHSGNSYLFNNAYTANDVAPYLVYGAVLDNQKAITVPGTFLQNHEYMSVFYKDGYTDLEMEGGPYLSCVYELFRPQRYPHNEIVNLYKCPFPIGMLHYASDTPFSKGKNLGARNLSYFGMDPTYATSIAILRHILKNECACIDLEEQPRV